MNTELGKRLEADARIAIGIDRERANEFEVMIRTKGWKLYVELMNARLQLFSDQMMAPAIDIGGVLRSEWLKGAMFAFVLSRDTPQMIMGQMKSLAGDEDDGKELEPKEQVP